MAAHISFSTPVNDSRSPPELITPPIAEWRNLREEVQRLAQRKHATQLKHIRILRFKDARSIVARFLETLVKLLGNFFLLHGEIRKETAG